MSNLDNWSLNFKEVFPPFVRKPFLQDPTAIFFNDTRTVAIIGLGKRREVLTTAAKGEGLDGEPANFEVGESPTGRFFKTASFPVDKNSFRIFRGLNNFQEISSEEYLLDEVAGYFVLYTPLRSGERLAIEYISESDMNYPRVFTSEQLQEVFRIYGEPSIENSLSLGAQAAFRNGAPRIVAVQGDHTGNDSSWFQAYKALELQQVYMVVPMVSSFYKFTVFAGLDHVQRMSETQYRRERVLLIGETHGTEDFNTLLRDSVEDFNNEERAIFIGADFARSIIRGETIEANGGLLASSVAGAWASKEYPPSTLTNQNILGITLNWPTRSLYSEEEIRQTLRRGLTLLLKGTGKVYISEFKTTIANGNAVEEEPSVWRIRDYIAINIRSTLENTFTGIPLLSDIASTIQEKVEDFLKAHIDQKIITSYSGIRVEVDRIEPRQINVAFDIAPVFPLNQIMLRINTVVSL